jgi:hypothetical protein
MTKIKKTAVLYQQNYVRTREKDIMVEGNKQYSIPEFSYLRGNLASKTHINSEIQKRMAKANA